MLFLVLIKPNSVFSQENNAQESSQLDNNINYFADDSIILDINKKKTYLYKNAHIDYGEIILDACYIEFNFDTKTVNAKYCLDSANQKIGLPILSDGATSTTSDSLKYNFETKKGITYQVKLQEGESYIHGEKVKRQNNGDIHVRNALYTTCDLDHPHFYFKLRKAIIKPDDKIVSGPVNLYVADIPTPLGLPFAFLPNKKNKSSNGIIIPTYGESKALGFYLLGGGYYHQFKGGKLSTLMTGDIYSKGSWGLGNTTKYRVRYKYNGQFQLSYRNVVQGEKQFPDYSKSKEFFVKWNHQNDNNFKPGRTFKALINAGTATNFRNDYNNISASNYLTNTFNSNIAWSKQFKGEISSNLSANLRHSQNSNTGLMIFTLPEISYNVNRFYPFKMLRKSTISKNFIHEIINSTNVNYQLNTKNELSVAGQGLINNSLEDLLNKSRNGMRHNINASSAIKLFGKNVTINPAYRLSSLWYLDQINREWNDLNNELTIDTIRKFDRIYSHSFSASATTKIYAFYQFAKFLKGKNQYKIRHTITPNINFSYQPNTHQWTSYQVDSLENTSTYSPFSNNIYGTINSSESGRIGFSLINSMELKRKNHNDSTDKEPFIKSKILDNFSISSGYDITKDSFNLDNIQFVGRTTLWKKVNLRFNGRMDPYKYSNGLRTSEYQFSSNKKLGTITSANLAIGSNLQSKKKNDQPYKSNKGSKEELEIINNNSDLYIDFNIPWTIGIDYKIDYRRTISPTNDTSFITQSIGLRGDLSITKNWKISYMTNYDFVRKEFSFTSVNIARDLHCWQMGFNWIPFGFMRSYNLNIRVKSALLQDLKLQRRRTWYDNNIP
ncbi:MAG: putative LPS assembly protein LptD [Parvicellaceae bacterium]